MSQYLIPTNAELMRDDYEMPQLWFTLYETEDELKEADVKFDWNKNDEIEIYSIKDEAGNNIENLLEPDTIYEIMEKCKQYFNTNRNTSRNTSSWNRWR